MSLAGKPSATEEAQSRGSGLRMNIGTAKGGKVPGAMLRGRRGRVVGWIAAAMLAGPALLAIGFAVFLATLQYRETEIGGRADAIIVLTGGPERIGEAVDLLAAGHAGRLLISGVHASTSASDIAELAPAARNYLRCCIDLGHHARNTVGNAAEAERWMRARGFRSALVVTSNYHMPRAMVELVRHMPEARLVPAPVITARPIFSGLPRDPHHLRLLATEYLKFVVASARAGLTPRPRSDDIAGIGGRQGS